MKIFKKFNLENDLEYKEEELKALISQFQQANKNFPNENIPLSSSTGRIFDTVSFLLGACKIKTYRGEPAMRLEGLASKGNPRKVKLEVKYNKKKGTYIINTSDLILDIVHLVDDPRNNPEDIAAKFQTEIGKAFANVAIDIAEKRSINKIGLTGGVAYNYSFSKTIKEIVFQSDFKFLEHDLIPPGDAGISTGQLIGGVFRNNRY